MAKYTEKRFDDILSSIETGKALGEACKENGVTPQSFHKWLREDKTKGKLKISKYARACEIRAEIIFEEIMQIADDPREDAIVTDSGIIMNTEFVQRSRLRIDARKWTLSKMNPKKYGDKIESTLVGDEQRPVIINLGNGIDPKSEA
jgi:hypothetical protein